MLERTGKSSGLLSNREFGKGSFYPQPISRVEETGLSALWLQDLALKVLYFQGYLTGYKIADEMSLPFQGIVDQLLEILKREIS